MVAPPAATVKGADGDQVNSALVPAQRAMAETVSGAVPLLPTEAGSDVEAPTVTPPRSRVGGDSVRCGVGAATPLPLKVTGMEGWFGSLLWTRKLPVSRPTAV